LNFFNPKTKATAQKIEKFFLKLSSDRGGV
jgi:hypothetical protein